MSASLAPTLPSPFHDTYNRRRRRLAQQGLKIFLKHEASLIRHETDLA
jgi:hypothetical protein